MGRRHQSRSAPRHPKRLKHFLALDADAIPQCLATPRTTDRGISLPCSSPSLRLHYDSRKLRHCLTEMSTRENASCESWVKGQKSVYYRYQSAVFGHRGIQKAENEPSRFPIAGRNRGSAISVRTLARDVTLCQTLIGAARNPTSCATHSQPIYSLVAPIYAKSRAYWAMSTIDNPALYNDHC